MLTVEGGLRAAVLLVRLAHRGKWVGYNADRAFRPRHHLFTTLVFVFEVR